MADTPVKLGLLKGCQTKRHVPLFVYHNIREFKAVNTQLR